MFQGKCQRVTGRLSFSQNYMFSCLGTKGATLRMKGCSGPGKTMIAMIAIMALEDFLVFKHHGNHVYQLDGDNLYMVSNF
jgi:adenylylsulfate kinase-like enzyme